MNTQIRQKTIIAKNSSIDCYLTNCKYCHKMYINEDCKEKLNNDINAEDILETINNIKNLLKQTLYQYSEQDFYVRNKMIEYIDRICTNLNFSDDTFYTSIEIFDEISRKFNFSLTNHDLILIGLTSIFLSCKLHEGKTIELNFLVETLGQGKYEKDDFLMTEILILKTLNFRLPKNYFIDFVNCTLKFILPSLHCLSTRVLYTKIKETYKQNLYLKTDSCDNLISFYISIIYNTIMNIADVKYDIILNNFVKFLKYYKINYNIDVNNRYFRNIYLNTREIICDCKL